MINEKTYENQTTEHSLNTLLLNLGRRGADDAAKALSEMIFKNISIDVSRVHMVSPIEMPHLLESHELQTVVIIEQLSQDLDCDLLLIFSIEESENLVKLFLEAMGIEGITQEEVMQEIGNILLGNFLNAFSNQLQLLLKPTPPRHYVDYFNAIIESYVTRLLYEEKNATLFDTSLRCAGVNIKGLILMFIGEDFKDKIILSNKLKT